MTRHLCSLQIANDSGGDRDEDGEGAMYVKHKAAYFIYLFRGY
jgi:hypothetical protein